MSAILERITTGLRTGFPNPGGPNQPPISLPGFRTTGMNPEMTDAVDKAMNLLAMAILASIETDHDIVPRAELTQLRSDSSAPAPVVAVHCRCDTGRRDPLMTLAVRGPTAIIDGSALLRGLSQRPVDCPH